jgi:asparagine synthase (glutamine-hydrolysing)
MCGIGGVYCAASRKVTSNDLDSLHAIQKVISPRGPDASGTYNDANVALVHTRLSIIDLDERSNQPMESPNWVLSYNGEIYNYRYLREQLSATHQFRTESDTEVLLLAIEEWGVEEALNKIAGMFAFLAYNKSENILYAARDRMGIKPLFVSRQNDDTYWFASTPAAICHALPDISWQENKLALGSYFILGAPFTKMSAIDGIERVPSAHFLKITPDGACSSKRYWQPEYQANFTIEDMVEIVREHQVSDVQSALFLSGGIDSTFLASVLDRIDFFHLDSPEKKYAKTVASQYDRPLVTVRPNPEDYSKGIEEVCRSFGEPLMSCGIPFSVAREAAKKGYKMALSANGADELFFGYPRTLIPGMDERFLPIHEDRSEKWFSYQLAHIFRDNRHFNISEYDSYLPSLIEIGISAIKSCQLEGFPTSASYRWLELMTYVLNDLNPTLDAASMANSLEVRVPFLDHRIVQGVLSWDTNILCDSKLGRKAPLKKWLARDFSQGFLNRAKLGFSIDNRTLSSISKLGKENFETMLNNRFLRTHENKKSRFYDRDMQYLENSCLVYSVWKQEMQTILSH